MEAIVSDYWKRIWDEHTTKETSGNPYKQVMRTKNKVPQSDDSLSIQVEHLKTFLVQGSDKSALDLCCGNGLVTSKLTDSFNRVVGVDFCKNLIDSATKNSTDIEFMCADIKTFNSASVGKFDNIIMTAALQHFTEAEVISIFENQYLALNTDGVLLVTDILDVEKRWQFYQTDEQKNAYFNALKQKQPIMGTWFSQSWLTELSRHLGFSSITILKQPEHFDFSHYRFDILLRK